MSVDSDYKGTEKRVVSGGIETVSPMPLRVAI